MHDIRKLSNHKISISPSLLAADFGRLEAEVAAIERTGVALLHLDVMDGNLVPNISFGIPVIAALRVKCDLIFDTHLMIAHPLDFVDSFAKSGADHLTFHWECKDDPIAVIAAIRASGCTVGISVKPHTPIEALLPLLDKIDLVLVMSVEPGFGGQSFLPEVLSKVSELRRAVEKIGRNVHIEIDGGISRLTAQDAARAGANLLVAGTSVFRNHQGAKKAVEELLEVQKDLDLYFEDENRDKKC